MGSLAYQLEAGVQAILQAGGLPQLLRQLQAADEAVVEAAVRCLHFLLQVLLCALPAALDLLLAGVALGSSPCWSRKTIVCRVHGARKW